MTETALTKLGKSSTIVFFGGSAILIFGLIIVLFSLLTISPVTPDTTLPEGVIDLVTPTQNNDDAFGLTYKAFWMFCTGFLSVLLIIHAGILMHSLLDKKANNPPHWCEFYIGYLTLIYLFVGSAITNYFAKIYLETHEHAAALIAQGTSLNTAACILTVATVIIITCRTILAQNQEDENET